MSARHLGAHELLALVLDDGSFQPWEDKPVQVLADDPSYTEELATARERSGTDEAVVAGEGRVDGRRVAVMACEYQFLAGSIGVAAAERLVQTVERATAENLPLLAAPASGGTRMQEGTIAFVGMIKICAAIVRHKRAGNPYLVYLRHPTTGGVLASWGSLGHMTAAEPKALIGFLGPRVYEVLRGEAFPTGVQVAENLLEHGLVDAVVTPEQLPRIAARVLAVLAAPSEALPLAADLVDDEPSDVSAWESIQRSRRFGRPGVRQLLRAEATDVTPLRGTGAGAYEPGLLLVLARFGGAPCVVLGQDRSRHPIGPAGFRQARRGMHLAAELGLPLVTVIDTPGAALSKLAEERGLAGEIARSLADLAMLSAPTLCVILGEGAGGAALALLPADRVVCAQHGWLSPLSPEGASAILYRRPDRAAEMARRQGVRSLDLHRAGIVDRVVAEKPDAADEPKEFLRRLAGVVASELVRLLRQSDADRLERRLARYRQLGSAFPNLGLDPRASSRSDAKTWRS